MIEQVVEKLPVVKKGGYNNSGLTKAEYLALHHKMRKRILKPQVCQFCFKVPPFDLMNLDGIYDENPNHWCWGCRSCHEVWDIEHGFRPTHHSDETKQKMIQNHARLSGEKHPFFGQHHSTEARQKISQNQLGDKHWNFGKKTPENVRQKISQNRQDISGDKHPMWGKHHSPESKFRLKLTWEGRKQAKLFFMSGRFQTRLAEGMN